MDDFSSTTQVFRYAPGIAERYECRGWIAVGVGVIFALFLLSIPLVSAFAFDRPLSLWLIILCVVLSPVILLISLRAALRAKSKWADDDRLAIAISDEGVTLPRVGLLSWSRIAAVCEQDIGMTTGNVSVAAFQFWLGTRDNTKLCVYVTDTLEQVGALSSRERRQIASGGPGGTFGWNAAFAQGLSDADYRNAVSVAVSAAQARGIPTTY